MKIDNHNVNISPVDINERKELGIKAGDTVRVWQKIEERGKIRLQAFEGVVLATKHGGEPGATFTVRKVASGVGVEKVFPLYSPMIDKIEIIKRVKVRRAKLYMLRDKVAREMKRILRRGTQVSIATKGAAELEEERKRAEAEEQARKEAEEKAQKEAEQKAAAEAKETEDTQEAQQPESEEKTNKTKDADSNKESAEE